MGERHSRVVELAARMLLTVSAVVTVCILAIFLVRRRRTVLPSRRTLFACACLLGVHLLCGYWWLGDHFGRKHAEIEARRHMAALLPERKRSTDLFNEAQRAELATMKCESEKRQLEGQIRMLNSGITVAQPTIGWCQSHTLAAYTPEQLADTEDKASRFLDELPSLMEAAVSKFNLPGPKGETIWDELTELRDPGCMAQTGKNDSFNTTDRHSFADWEPNIPCLSRLKPVHDVRGMDQQSSSQEVRGLCSFET